MKWFCETQSGGLPYMGKSEETLTFLYGSPSTRIYLAKIIIHKKWNNQEEKKHEFTIYVYPKNPNKGSCVFFNQAKADEVINITVSSGDDPGVQRLLHKISEILSKINPSASYDNECLVSAISAYFITRLRNPRRSSSFPAIENKESRLLKPLNVNTI